MQTLGLSVTLHRRLRVSRSPERLALLYAAPERLALLYARSPYASVADIFPASAALTRSGVNGTVRRRTPVASNTALASAAATGAVAASPAPSGGASSRWISSTSIAGTSGKVRIG